MIDYFQLTNANQIKDFIRIDLNGKRYYLASTVTSINADNAEKLFADAYYVYDTVNKVILKARGMPSFDAESLLNRVISLEREIAELRAKNIQQYPTYRPMEPLAPMLGTPAPKAVALAASGHSVINDEKKYEFEPYQLPQSFDSDAPYGGMGSMR